MEALFHRFYRLSAFLPLPTLHVAPLSFFHICMVQIRVTIFLYVTDANSCTLLTTDHCSGLRDIPAYISSRLLKNEFYQLFSSLTETDSGISREASPDDIEIGGFSNSSKARHRERSVDVTVHSNASPLIASANQNIHQTQNGRSLMTNGGSADVTVLSANSATNGIDTSKSLNIDANETISSNKYDSLWFIHSYKFIYSYTYFNM